MGLLKRFIAWLRGLFSRKVIDLPFSMTAITTTSPLDDKVEHITIPAPLPRDEVDPLGRAYGKYTKWMKRRGMKPGGRMNFVKGKHPLHYAHFGTFAPLKPLKGQTDVSKSAEIHRERERKAMYGTA